MSWAKLIELVREEYTKEALKIWPGDAEEDIGEACANYAEMIQSERLAIGLIEKIQDMDKKLDAILDKLG